MCADEIKPVIAEDAAFGSGLDIGFKCHLCRLRIGLGPEGGGIKPGGGEDGVASGLRHQIGLVAPDGIEDRTVITRENT